MLLVIFRQMFGFYWTEIENILSKLGQSNIASPSAQYDKLHLIFFVPSFFLERITPNFLCVAFYFKLLALFVYIFILKKKKIINNLSLLGHLQL